MEIENRLSYFREDMGINIHHWHWHLVYPHTMDGDSGIEIVNKDRRGELFYYMHQQVLARYDTLDEKQKKNKYRHPHRFTFIFRFLSLDTIWND